MPEKVTNKNMDMNNRKDKTSKDAPVKKKRFVDFLVEIKRVTKVTKGGKRLRFKVFAVSGNERGKIGISKGAAKDISSAAAKATGRAKKFLFSVPLQGKTIPYTMYGRHGASSVVLMPAHKGTGLIAGGAMRFVLKALGVQDIVAKAIRNSSDANLVKATLNALSKGRRLDHIASLRGKTKEQIILGAHYENDAVEPVS